MDDLVNRLRDRAYSSKVPDPLCEEAAGVIDKLRQRIRLADAALRSESPVTEPMPKEKRAETSDKPCPYVTGTVTRYCTLTPLTLTDAEREAVRKAADAYALSDDDDECAEIATTLRGLLERTK